MMMRVLSLSLGVLLALAGGAHAKEVIRFAYFADPARAAAFHAVEQKLVTSPTVDAQVVALPFQAIIQAATTREYDVVEISPMAPPRAAERGFHFVLFSAGVEPRDNSKLFVRADSPIKSPRDLKGKTLAVGSFGAAYTLQIRYLLKKEFGFNVDLKAGDIQFLEVPEDQVATLLTRGRIDAAVVANIASYRLQQQADVRYVYSTDPEWHKQFGVAASTSLIATYPDRVAQKAEALREFRRLLEASIQYFREHPQEVLEAVSKRFAGADLRYMRWWWDVQAYARPFDDAAVKSILSVWKAAVDVGDIRGYPDVQAMLFR